LSFAASSTTFCRIVAEFIVDETDIELRSSMSFSLADFNNEQVDSALLVISSQKPSSIPCQTKNLKL
jgi:hypothetical protein